MCKRDRVRLPAETTFEISLIRVLLAVFGLAVASAFFLYMFVRSGQVLPAFLGFGGAWTAGTTLFHGMKRPSLKLDVSGLTWGLHRLSWQEIRTFKTIKTQYDRSIWVYFEGNEKPFVPSGSKLRDLWRKLFPEEQPFAIDISYFKASNDEIEDAMDLYYFPARGLEFDEDDHLFDNQSK